MLKIVPQKPQKDFLTNQDLSSLPLWITRKYRGFTGVATVRNGIASFASGSGDMPFALPHISFRRDGIFVGEIYTPGTEDENSLQMALNGDAGKIRFAMFDVLAAGDESLEFKPLGERIKYINDACGDCAHIVEETKLSTREDLMRQILTTGGGMWKFKPQNSLEFDVVGISETTIECRSRLGFLPGVHTFGSFIRTLDFNSLKIGDVVEVSFNSIDRAGHLVNPVVINVRDLRIG